MPSIFDNFLTQLATGDSIKDYKHASKLFVDNNYERSPKYSWLFHVYFDLNPEFTTLSQQQQVEAGMLVKSADLPRFKVDTKVYNSYNRPSIAQSKTRFEDVTISFHDDSANIVRKLWFDYYSFYYRDADNNYGDATGALNDAYLQNNKQDPGQRNLYNKFGYTPKKTSLRTTRYINAIRIYSLHQKRFSEYTLINPVITSYRHGTHAAGQENTLENSMTISYETVLYASGSAKVARGFANLHYDTAPSPLTPAGGGTNSILGPGGIVNTIDEVISDGSNKNWGSAAFKALRGYQKNKNVDLTNLAKGELIQAFNNVLRTGEFGSALNSTYIPYKGADVNSNSFRSALPTQTTAASGSVGSNGFNLTAGASAVTGGIATALKGTPLAGASTTVSGLLSNASGLLAGADPNKIVSLAKNSTSGLTATATSSIPTNSFTSAIEYANDQLKAAAISNSMKNLQETAGKSASLLASGAQGVGAVFQNGTSTLAAEASAFSQTPFAKYQIPATAAVASEAASTNLVPTNIFANYSLPIDTSTNAAPVQTADAQRTGGGYGRFT